MGGWDGCAAYESSGWVVGLVKRDFITHSGSSEHSLESESKFEPSVAIDTTIDVTVCYLGGGWVHRAINFYLNVATLGSNLDSESKLCSEEPE